MKYLRLLQRFFYFFFLLDRDLLEVSVLLLHWNPCHQSDYIYSLLCVLSLSFPVFLSLSFSLLSATSTTISAGLTARTKATPLAWIPLQGRWIWLTNARPARRRWKTCTYRGGAVILHRRVCRRNNKSSLREKKEREVIVLVSGICLFVSC